jgi:hypothetical protein
MCDITPAGLVAAVPEVTQDFGYFRTLGTSAAPSGRARLTRSSTPTYGPAPASARCPVPNGWPGTGVLKRRLLFLYGRPWLSPVVRLIRPGLSGYTVVRYRLLARRVARQLIGYQRSGFDVVGVVGVDASPTCGVTTTLDLGPVSGRGRCLPLGPPRPPLHERHRPQWLGGARSRPVHRRAQ